MRKFTKIATLVAAAAIAASTCSLLAGCGTSQISYNEFSATLDEFAAKMPLANKCSMEFKAGINIKTTDSSNLPQLEVSLTGSNDLLKHGDSLLDLKNNLHITSTKGITDDIEMLVGSSFYFGSYNMKTDKDEAVDYEETNGVYVRDDTEYLVKNDELTGVYSGQMYDGDLSRSVAKEFITRAVSVGDFFDEELRDFFEYPKEVSYKEYDIDQSSRISGKLQDVEYSAKRSGDKVEVVLSAEVRHDANISSSLTSGLDSEEYKEFYGHFNNRDFISNVTFELTLNSSPFLTKGKFEKLNIDELTSNLLYITGDSFVGSIDNGADVAVLGGGSETFNDIVYKNGSYVKENADTCSFSISCNEFVYEISGSQYFTTSQSFSNKDYEYSDRKLRISSSALNHAEQEILEYARNRYHNYNDTSYRSFSTILRQATISMTYRTLVDNPVKNARGSYDSDQYKTVKSSITFYYHEN